MAEVEREPGNPQQAVGDAVAERAAELAAEVTEADRETDRRRLVASVTGAARAGARATGRGVRTGAGATGRGVRAGAGATGRRMLAGARATGRGVRAARRGMGSRRGRLTEQVVAMAQRLRVRDQAALRAQFPGRSTEEIADALIEGAARASATVGGAVGAWAALPVLPAYPVEVATETLALIGIEVKLVAELH